MKKYIDGYEEQLCSFILNDIEAEKRKINGWIENIIKDASRDILKAEALGRDEKHGIRIRKHINKLMAVKKLVVDKPLEFEEANRVRYLMDFLLELRNSIVIKEFQCEILSMRREMLSDGKEENFENADLKRLYNRFMNLYNRFYLSIYLIDKSDVEELHEYVAETVKSGEMGAGEKKDALVYSIKKMYRLQEKLKNEEAFYMEKAEETIISEFNIFYEETEEKYV